MRAGHTHKTKNERVVTSARAQVMMALDNLDEPDKVKEILESVEMMLRSAELHMGTGRLKTGEAAADLDPPTLDWVHSMFTEEHATAACANLHSELEDVSPAFSPQKRTAKRMSLHASLKSILADDKVVGALDRAGHFDFDALAYHGLPAVQGSPVSILGMHLCTRGPNGDLLNHMHEMDRFERPKVFSAALECFLGKVDEKYNPEALYHGCAHAADGMSTTSWFISSEFIKSGKMRTNYLENFMCLVAAGIHDVGHMGRNNLFYTSTMHELAVRYNDKSCLENMHLATSFGFMKDDEACNWFALLKGGAKQYTRNGLVSMVLATDPSKHAKHQKAFAEIVHEVKENPDGEPLSPTKAATPAEKQKILDDKLLMLGTLLHAADVSNPTKAQDMMLGWTSRLLKEFWAQGDEEARLGFPMSPLCDRATGSTSVPKGQLGFVMFVISPFYKIIAEVIDETKEAMDSLAKNVEYWKEKDAAGATFEQIFGEPSVVAVK